MKVYKVYSGKTGCMCGCRGRYSYTAQGAQELGPGYDVTDSVNERSVKIIEGKVLRSSNTKTEDQGRFKYTLQGDRILVAFYA